MKFTVRLKEKNRKMSASSDSTRCYADDRIVDEKCEVDECNEAVKARGLCNNHSTAFYTHGTPTPALKCRNCRKEYIYKGKKLGYSVAFCPKCYVIYQQFIKTSPGTSTQNHIKFSRHGLNVFSYQQLWESQEGKCAICNHIPKILEIDHDRKCCNLSRNMSCGKCIRGLLCHNCNCMLGHYERCQGNLLLDVLDRYIKNNYMNKRST